MFGETVANIWTSISGDFFQFLIYAAIAALFVVAMLRCVVPVSRTKAKLTSATRALKKHPEDSLWQDKHFLGKGALLPCWSEYLNSRFFADDEYHNATPVESYINEDSVITVPSHAGFSDAAPSMMVSLGFLGTLVGFMIGLKDFNMDNADAMMSAIRVLLGGMRYAFMTSIVGIIGSLSYSTISSSVFGGARKALDAFYEALHRQSAAVTVDPITQIAIYQQEQTALIQSMAESIGAGAMTDKLGSVLEMALQPLQASLDDFISVSTREQLRGMELIVNRFVDNMDGALAGQFDNLKSTISETCRFQAQTYDTVRETMEGLSRVSRDIVQVEQLAESLVTKFDGYVSRLGAAQMQVDEGFSSVAGVVKGMEGVARQQANYVAQIGQMQSEVGKEIAGFQTAADAFMKAYSENANLSTSALRKVSEELRRNGDVLNDAHKTFIAGVNKELGKTFDQFDANLSDITDQLGRVIAQIKDSVNALPSVIEDSAGEYAEQLRRLAASMRDAQALLDDALRGGRAPRGGM